MKNKLVSADEAVAIIREGDTVSTSGFVGIGNPDELLAALEKRFLAEQSPRDLTLLFAAGQGDGGKKGLNRLGHDGLLKRVVGGHWGLIPKVSQLALEGKIEAYNLPQGCISQMYRDMAAGKPGTLSRVGLHTFVDPRKDGGKLNEMTQQDLVQLLTLDGQEWLFYKSVPIDVALLRGTTADLAGNITMEKEALTLDVLAMAMAAKSNGGCVLVQVERIAKNGSLNPRSVQVPGILVDCVVVSQPENHMQTYGTHYSPGFAAEIAVPLESVTLGELDVRKIISRRAALELKANSIINLGIGMPEGVAAVANEEKIAELITLTAEPGVIGGVPAGGLDFGAAVNTDAIIDQNQQFDYYDGGGLDLACLGMAECDRQGNVNVSRFGPKLAGAGGFINISQNARTVVFMGTFTAGGLQARVAEGQLRIEKEGRAKKFVEQVEHVTFSGEHAARCGQRILYVTERCVFRLDEQGLTLVEVAPGIDIERDILSRMGFRPAVDNPALMDRRIFLDETMGLLSALTDMDITRRIVFDTQRQLLFLNFEGMSVNTLREVKEIHREVEKLCKAHGRPVDVLVNYENATINDAIAEHYAAMVHDLTSKYYRKISRYTTSAFTRMKLGNVIPSSGASHIFDNEEGAQEFLKK